MKLIKSLLAVSILLTAQFILAQQKNDDDAAAYMAYYLLQKQVKDRKDAEEKKQREAGYHGQIEAIKAKDCGLIVPNDTPTALIEVLMAKGYRPANVLPQYKNSPELTGVAFLEVRSRLFNSDLLVIGVNGDKNIFSSSQASALPNCTEQ